MRNKHSLLLRGKEMIEIFADLSKDDMIEEITHPETKSLKYMRT